MNSLVQIIEPKGILDSTKTQDFHHQLNKNIEVGAQIILVDFQDVTFMDSSGLGALVKALKIANTADVQLFLCSLNEQIKMLFELTSMDSYFNIYSSREEFEKQLKEQ
ncbi:MAG: STAS domain-containing protein [Pleurocapsa sp.]